MSFQKLGSQVICGLQSQPAYQLYSARFRDQLPPWMSAKVHTVTGIGVLISLHRGHCTDRQMIELVSPYIRTHGVPTLMKHAINCVIRGLNISQVPTKFSD
jgi:hypothetical protein